MGLAPCGAAAPEEGGFHGGAGRLREKPRVPNTHRTPAWVNSILENDGGS